MAGLGLLRRSAGSAAGEAADPAAMGELWRRAEAAAAALPAYSVSADRRLRAGARGVHARRRAGPGDTFWQFRPYEPGEPASRIDWRRSARSDSLFVRQHEWETAQNVWIWVDGSASMHFRSGAAGASKSDRAVVLALAAAKLLVGAGERIALYGADTRPAGGQYGLNRLRDALDRARTGPDEAFPPARALPRFSHLLLIGDFLGEENAAYERLRRLVALGVEGHLLQILDPVEDEFPYRGRVAFEGLEDGESILLERSDDLAAAYRRHLRAWIDSLRAVCGRTGWSHSLHRTDSPATAALMSVMALTGRSR